MPPGPHTTHKRVKRLRSHSATKRERDVDTAKLKAGGALTGGRLAPLQGGPRAKGSQVRCRWPEPAGRKGGARNALRQGIRSARYSGQRLLMRAWRSTSHARHTKCAKRGAGHAHPPFIHARARARAGEQWSGCGTLTLSLRRQTDAASTYAATPHAPEPEEKNSFKSSSLQNVTTVRPKA